MMPVGQIMYICIVTKVTIPTVGDIIHPQALPKHLYSHFLLVGFIVRYEILPAAGGDGLHTMVMQMKDRLEKYTW